MKGVATHEKGFQPVYDCNSKVLILGSFPSVKSREMQFYYGHKQNRFWKTMCAYVHEEIPQTVEGKRNFLLRNRVALWDVAHSCDIIGSSDASMKNVEVVDLSEIFAVAKLERIFLNGNLAYQLFISKYADVKIPYQKLPSTSPTNPRFSAQIWIDALNIVFGNA